MASQPLSPGARDVAQPDSDPAPTPGQVWEAAQGTQPSPSYTPPSREEVLNTKAHVVRHDQGLALIRHNIDELEVVLSRIDPQRVLACDVPGYTDPPERIAAAERDKAAGFVTVDPDIVTFKEIQSTKQQITQLRALIQQAETHNDFLEWDLSMVDPARVCACHVAGYKDHPATIARAEAAKAANIGD